MKLNKINYNKLNSKLYQKLFNIDYIKNIKYLKLNKNVYNILYNKKTLNYIKILKTFSNYFKLNYKELIKIKKKLKSGSLILSTSLGIITDKKAILNKVGGIALCYIN